MEQGLLWADDRRLFSALKCVEFGMASLRPLSLSVADFSHIENLCLYLIQYLVPGRISGTASGALAVWVLRHEAAV
jgi:hypothetical protein